MWKILVVLTMLDGNVRELTVPDQYFYTEDRCNKYLFQPHIKLEANRRFNKYPKWTIACVPDKEQQGA